MSKPAPLSEQERADLVAYLDGELGGEAARAIETKISLDPTYRLEAESLKRAWDLLDFLPRPEPSPSFTERTLSKIAVKQKPPVPLPSAPKPVPQLSQWPPYLLGVTWAAAVVLAGWIGYQGYFLLVPREPGEQELVRDLRLIENKRFYDLVEEMEFLQQLDAPELFGEDTGG